MPSASRVYHIQYHISIRLQWLLCLHWPPPPAVRPARGARHRPDRAQLDRADHAPHRHVGRPLPGTHARPRAGLLVKPPARRVLAHGAGRVDWRKFTGERGGNYYFEACFCCSGSISCCPRRGAMSSKRFLTAFSLAQSSMASISGRRATRWSSITILREIDFCQGLR